MPARDLAACAVHARMSAMRTSLYLALAYLLAACGAPPAKPEPPRTADQATVPLRIEGNRPYIDVTFRKADGASHTARFLIDSGGGGFLLTEPLARELGLALGETSEGEGEKLAKTSSPVNAFVGSLPLELHPERILILIGKDNIVPPVAPGHADGMLPGHVLARYHVVFDYPAGTFTIARPGALAPRGTAMAMPVSTEWGFPRTELQVDGTTHGFLLDTGASFTMVSDALLKAWGSAHADWKRYPGAYGDAATLGGKTLETMFVPRATWGAMPLTDVGVTSQPEGGFENRMSSMMTAPIIGSLAGNVLSHFRVELDYPDQKLYLSP
jgi:predicted aspartyl protease